MSLKSLTIHSIRPHCKYICVCVYRIVHVIIRTISQAFITAECKKISIGYKCRATTKQQEEKKLPINCVAYEMHLLDTNKPIKSNKEKNRAREQEIFMQFECIILLLSLEIITWQANECNEVRKAVTRSCESVAVRHTYTQQQRNGKTQSLNDLRGSQLK